MAPLIEQALKWGEQFIGLFYPRLCLICDRELVTGEEHLCLHCLAEMPKTGFHAQIGNPMEQLFYGKVDIDKASGYFFFHQQSCFRKVIHAIKYQDEKKAGFELGKSYGQELQLAECYCDIDIIIPVPLHKKRFRHRGYNQSEWIARGLASTLKKEVFADILFRFGSNASQTHKSVYDRWLNTRELFSVRPDADLSRKKILLVDDVITTGATLQSCALALKAHAPDCRISIATLAVTE